MAFAVIVSMVVVVMVVHAGFIFTAIAVFHTVVNPIHWDGFAIIAHELFISAHVCLILTAGTVFHTVVDPIHWDGFAIVTVEVVISCPWIIIA